MEYGFAELYKLLADSPEAKNPDLHSIFKFLEESKKNADVMTDIRTKLSEGIDLKYVILKSTHSKQVIIN